MTSIIARDPSAGRWMYRTPAWTLMALMLSGMVLYGAVDFHVARNWTHAQQVMFVPYLKSLAFSTVGLTNGTYTLPEFCKEARVICAWYPQRSYPNAKVSEWLHVEVYRGRTLANLFALPAGVTLFVLVVGLVIAVPRDLAAKRTRRLGRWLKGPRIWTAHEFNRVVKGDGLRIEQTRGAAVLIPAAAHNSHQLVLGDTGTGKTSFLLQELKQIRRWDHPAVIFDRKGDYTSRFYDPERGDIILDPLDARFPGWAFQDETRTDAEALTIAQSLFQLKWNDQPFFVITPREIFAHMMNFRHPHTGERPTAERMVRWLRSPELLDRLVAGTHLEAALSPNAGPMREGVRASFITAASALSLLPPTPQDGGWSATNWCRNRRGWIFVKSQQGTFDRQMTLMSLWLDLMILRLLEGGGPQTWIVIDEVASLRYLPQLATALTELRSSNTAIIIGAQSALQIEDIYGDKKGRLMLSQPKFAVYMRTREPGAARWIADSIGKAEYERPRETRTDGKKTWMLERFEEYPILPSQFTLLPDLSGVLSYLGNITPITFAPMPVAPIAPAFIPREEPDQEPPRMTVTVNPIPPNSELPNGAQPGLIF